MKQKGKLVTIWSTVTQIQAHSQTPTAETTLDITDANKLDSNLKISRYFV